MGVTGPGIPIAVFVITNIILFFTNERFPLARLLRLPRLLLISNRSELVPPGARPRKWFCWDLLNPNHQATSFFIRPVELLVLRFVYMLYFAATLLVYRFADPGGLGTPGDYFKFLTNLSFILFGLSGLLGIAVVLHHMLRGPCRVLPPPTRPPSPAAVPNSAAAHTAPAAAPRPAAQAPGVPTPNGVTPPAAGGAARVPFPYPMLPASAAPSSAAGHAPDRAGAGSGQWHGPSAGPGPAEEGPGDAVGAVHDADVHALVSGDWPVYESKDGAVAQYPLLFKLHLLFMETNACMALFITAFYWGLVHGCHNLFILLDLALSRTPLVSYHYQVLWWYGTAYAIVLWSIAAATGEWVYPNMDWSDPYSLVAYVLLPILPFIAFLLWFYLVARPREWLGHRLTAGPRHAAAAGQGGGRAAEPRGAAKV